MRACPTNRSCRDTGRWFVIFRLYGPGTPFFDKSWRMPDIEQVSN